MTRLLTITLFLGALLTPAFAQVRPNAQRQAPGPRQLGRLDGTPEGRPGRPASLEETVDRFYAVQFRQRIQLNEEQFQAALPQLRLALRERREIGVRRNRLVNRLKQAAESGASEEELKQQIEDVDRVNTEMQASQERFLRGVDPLLTVPQRARLRVFEANIEQQIRNMLDRAKVPE